MKETARFKIYKHISSLLLVAFTLIPFGILMVTSLRSSEDLGRKGPISLPDAIVWSNYPKAWELGNFSTYFKNSMICMAATVTFVLVLALLGAYVLSFHEFFGKQVLISVIMLGVLIPFTQIMIPLFHTLKGMNLLNTLWAIILPQTAMQIPFSVFLMRGFMRDLPKSVIESARLDGANEVQTLFYIVTPLVRPALVALLIFTAVSSWNNFMLPTVMIQKDALRTVPVGLNYFKDQHFTNFPMMCAAANIIIVPILLVYLTFQQKMIQGMTVGSLKG